MTLLQPYERESRLNVALNYIHTNYAESIRQEHVAELMNMSASAFCRVFKRCTGKPFVRYLNELRVGYACRLLMETDRTVAEICFEVGFGNLSHFNRLFREIKGTTPSAFRHHGLGAAT